MHGAYGTLAGRNGAIRAPANESDASEGNWKALLTFYAPLSYRIKYQLFPVNEPFILRLGTLDDRVAWDLHLRVGLLNWLVDSLVNFGVRCGSAGRGESVRRRRCVRVSSLRRGLRVLR